MHALRFSPSTAAQIPVFHVDDTQRYQALTGYGAAMTDTSAWLLDDHLSPNARAQVIENLFGPSGLRMNFVRVPMGGSDFTVAGTGYSYDDVPAGESDPDMAGFSIAHDQANIIPVLHAVLSVDPNVELFSNPWSPPAWMKTSDGFAGAGGSTLLPGMETPLAAYFVRYVQAYAQQGVRISDLSPENEPLSTALFPAMQLPADREADFVQSYLRPALTAAGLNPAIWGADGADLNYATELEQSAAANEFAGVAWHCYAGGNAEMGSFHAVYPDVPDIVSECSPGINPYGVAETFIDATRNWASKVALWNIALDPSGGPVQAPNSGCGGCTALVRINEATNQVSYNRDYYEFGQISKFVDPGAVRIYSDRFVSDFGADTYSYGVTPGIDNVAFLNPNGSHVLVAYDTDAVAHAFAVSWHGMQFSYTLPAHTTVTFTWR